MTLAIFGLSLSGDDLVGLILAIFVAAYLVYALLRPEKL
jgi:K+-transporting ATPase KdpF subunit